MSKTNDKWAEIKKKYCFGHVVNGVHIFPSYNELSKIFEVNRSTIKRKADKERWDITKASFTNKTLDKLEEKVNKKKAQQNSATESEKCNTVAQQPDNTSATKFHLTQADIDAESDKLSDNIMLFDVTCNAVAVDVVNLIKRNIDLIKTGIEAQEREYKTSGDAKAIKPVNPSEILENVKALEKIQAVYKNTIGEMLPNGKGTENHITMFTQINRMQTVEIEQEIRKLESATK